MAAAPTFHIGRRAAAAGALSAAACIQAWAGRGINVENSAISSARARAQPHVRMLPNKAVRCPRPVILARLVLPKAAFVAPAELSNICIYIPLTSTFNEQVKSMSKIYSVVINISINNS